MAELLPASDDRVLSLFLKAGIEDGRQAAAALQVTCNGDTVPRGETFADGRATRFFDSVACNSIELQQAVGASNLTAVRVRHIRNLSC